MALPTLSIFGDSSVIINWFMGTDALSPPELSHWCRVIKLLCNSFSYLSFNHLYHEYNMIVDCQSKAILDLAPGTYIFSEYFEDHLVLHDSLMLF